MVSVRYSRSVLHKNSIQESVLELLPGLALEKIVECDGVWFAPRERVHPPLMPGERPRCSELGDEADHLAFFLPAAARRMNSAAPRFLRPMYAARALGSSAPSFLSCVASLLNFDFFFMWLWLRYSYRSPLCYPRDHANCFQSMTEESHHPIFEQTRMSRPFSRIDHHANHFSLL